MENQNLTKAERKELRRQEKQTQKNQSAQSNTFKRILTWGLVILGIVLAVWGMLKLASTPVDNTPLAGEVTADDWIKGNPAADVVLVEYSDFQCPACGVYYPIVKQLVAKYSNDITFVYRHFPLSQHQNARPAAYAAEAAGQQGKFWEMHDTIFENQNTWSEDNNAVGILRGYAQNLGLDLNKYDAAVSSQEVRNKVENHYTSGIQSNVTYTPTFYLNGQKIANPQNLEEFRTLIQAALDGN
ncbi:MAG: thioredoxin domain-containing protein [Patescibacteria group bacterium]